MHLHIKKGLITPYIKAHHHVKKKKKKKTRLKQKILSSSSLLPFALLFFYSKLDLRSYTRNHCYIIQYLTLQIYVGRNIIKIKDNDNI